MKPKSEYNDTPIRVIRNEGKPRRVRLSLETTEGFKQELIDHGKDLGTKSLIGIIRKSVRRSRDLAVLERESGVTPM